MQRMLGVLACVGLCVQAAYAWAEALPMVTRASLMTARAPVIAEPDGLSRASPSLFNGSSGKSMFAIPDRPHPDMPNAYSVLRGAGTGPMGKLRSLIAEAEAGAKGYDAVQYGAKVRPNAPPTALTIQQIYDWIEKTPGQPHAIGRYQFIPPTLRRLVTRAKIDPKSRFTPRVQDQLADILLAEAGLKRFTTGEMARHAFMNNLAKIWAGLPNHTGKSHYHGYAGNKATMTWAYFDERMQHIFPG